MRLSLQRGFTAVAVLFLGVGSAYATCPTETHSAAPTSLRSQSSSEEIAAMASLREDVARHPSDFVTFETRIGADRFIAEHEGAFHETERRVVLRGVVGYWQGKTLVVLPSLSISDRL